MIGALVSWAAALAADLAGAPTEAQAAMAGLAAGAAMLIAWGAAAELRGRAFARRNKQVDRLSRRLFAAAGLRRRARR